LKKITPKTRKVLLLIESSRAFEQGILKGIADYSHLYGPMIFYRNIPRVSGGSRLTLAQIKKLHPDGIIVREQDITEKLLTLNLPTIVSPYSKPFDGLPNILTNDQAISKMAALHLLDRGFKNFGFFGFDNKFYWSLNRCESFAKNLSKTSNSISVYKKNPAKNSQSEHVQIAQWLESLPKPVAVMAANDDHSYALFEAIKIAGLQVPETVAIIGVGNDEIVCGLNTPPLSSVALNTQAAGFKAAQMLDKMIRGDKVRTKNIIVEPLRVVERNSTDILAIHDESVVGAIRFIRQHCNEMIQVDDVAQAVNLSRRQLYNKFKATLGRSVYQQIRRFRMTHAARMLIDTNMSVADIAISLGFTDTKNISRCFREEQGTTMLAYRRKYGK
jgi:LacI family transcriptional regulator